MKNKCLSCEKPIENPKENINFIWWPTPLKTNKLCKKCAKEHLTEDAFRQYFEPTFPVKMKRRSCWEPERFSDVTHAKDEKEYQELKKKGYIICYE